MIDEAEQYTAKVFDIELERARQFDGIAAA